MTENNKRFTFDNKSLLKDGEFWLDGSVATICNAEEIVELLNELAEENNKIKSILLKKVEELNDAYNKSAKAGMPTGGIIGELDSFEEICKIIGWIE